MKKGRESPKLILIKNYKSGIEFIFIIGSIESVLEDGMPPLGLEPRCSSTAS